MATRIQAGAWRSYCHNRNQAARFYTQGNIENDLEINTEKTTEKPRPEKPEAPNNLNNERRTRFT